MAKGHPSKDTVKIVTGRDNNTSHKKIPLPLFHNALLFSLCHSFCILWGGTISIDVFFIKMGLKYLSSYARTCEGHAEKVLHAHTHSQNILWCTSVFICSDITWLGYCVYFPRLHNIQNTSRHVLVLNQYTDEQLCLQRNIPTLLGLFIKSSYYPVKLSF